MFALFRDLRLTTPRVIQSPPTQPRRASVALIVRLRPAPELVFEGREPEGYHGPIVPEAEFGLSHTLEDFFRLRKSPLRPIGFAVPSILIFYGALF